MVRIPPDVVIKSTIRPGSVYYFPHERVALGEPHYFVVINLAPTTEKVILLVCASSKVKVVLARYKDSPKTLVQMNPSQYPGFTLPSIFDCNSVFEETVDKLVKRRTSGALELKPEMDIHLVEQLRASVLTSRLVPKGIKNQLSAKP